MSIVTRTCHRCKVARPLDAFYIAAEERQSARAGKRRKMPCRFCTQETAKKRRKPLQDYIDAVKTETGCVDCGIHPEVLSVLEFDHPHR